jgi:hypothetical protein
MEWWNIILFIAVILLTIKVAILESIIGKIDYKNDMLKEITENLNARICNVDLICKDILGYIKVLTDKKIEDIKDEIQTMETTYTKEAVKDAD